MRYFLCLFSAFLCLIGAGAAQQPKVVAQGAYGLAKGTNGKPMSMLNWVISNGGDGDLIQVLIALMVVGILLWLVNRYIPMRIGIKLILNAVVVVVVVLWLLNAFWVN